MPKKVRRTSLAQLKRTLETNPDSITSARGPTRVTVDGRDAIVILSVAEYESFLGSLAKTDVADDVRKGRRDLRAGLAQPWDEVRSEALSAIKAAKPRRRRTA